ncbi:S1C family serine protease [Flavobacterium sp. H122]|uniref:S1C family serine protease n=1 Tax=Flavobacterium sp. H122 TaxID=2529860 RepID=UPI0010AADBC7|nr:S1C family serine protease [Flavobacterium sp. H122]
MNTCSLNIKKHFFFIFSLINFNAFSQNSSLDLIITNPEGAEILDDNGQKLGETPFDYKKIDKQISKIKIVKENYNTIELSLKDKRKNNLSFLDAVNECNSCIIDSEKDSKSNVLKLTKSFKELENTVLAGIEIPILKIDENHILGEINGSKKRLKDKDIYRLLGYPENMEMRIINSFNSSYINAVYFSRKNAEKDVSTLQSPKIILKPVIKNMNFNLNGKLLRDYTGTCSLECEWQVFALSDLENPIKTFTVRTQYYRAGNNYELLLHEMVSLSERHLLEEDSLYSLITEAEQKYLEKSKGDSVKLPLPLNRSFSNTSEMLKEVVNSVVTVETEGKFGSGVFITDNGHLITNYHVIEGNKPIFVKIENGNKVKAEIVKHNKDFDLAVLKVNINNIKGLSFSDSGKTSLGDDVYAIGTPLDKKLVQSISKGIISGYRKYNGVNFIQSDININSGNSGGPMLNLKGEIIGINTMKASGTNVSGIGFSIPSNVVLKMLNIQQ